MNGGQKKTLGVEDFTKSDYKYGIGEYAHIDGNQLCHFELLSCKPLKEYNPGKQKYKLLRIRPMQYIYFK